MNREERLERTMSMAQNKGLLNNPGENNCFLNSAVQVFWHLDVFRRSFRELKGHFCKGKSCIFCALENIFKEFQYSSDDALPPDTLRIAMASTFRDQRKFQMGDMDDAAECFENILSYMHHHLVMSEHDDGCNAQHCITHQKFAMQLIEQTICPCGERSEPLPFFQTVHYVSASALCAQAKRFEKQHRYEYDSTKHFDTLLKLTGEDTKPCTSPDCGEKIQVQRLLLNCPDIVSIGLNWDSESPDADHIAEVLQCIGTSLSLPYFFHQVFEKKAQHTTLNLVGVVTYYGKHYSTFFFHSKLQTWIYFDDARVREIGPDWSVIREKCRRCHYQPLLLLYANPKGTPINAAAAPKEKILIKLSTFERKTDMNPMNRRISAEVSRLEFERHRKRRSSSPESGLVETDSESNISTLKSEKEQSKSLSTMEGSDDTLKASSDKNTTHTSLNDDGDHTLKAKDPSPRSRKDKVSPTKSRRSKSCDILDEGASRSSKIRVRGRSRSSSSDVTDTLKQKHRNKNEKPKKTGLRRIGSAIFQAMKPAVAISHMKTSKKKNKDDRASTECNGNRGSMEFSPSCETTSKQNGLRMNEQAKLDDYLRSPSHDSGIGSASGSVSSSDTNHGGSDDDLVDYSHTHNALRNGFIIKNGKNKRGQPAGRSNERCAILLQEAENLAVQTQNAENCHEYLTAIHYCTEAATRFRQAADISGLQSNNGRYALMKEEQVKTKGEQLRRKFEAQSHLKMARTVSPQDEFLRQQRRRDEMILKQQQQNHAQYGTLPRNLPTYKQLYPAPSASISTKLEDTAASTKSGSCYQSIATLPVKPKRNSSNHYTNRANSTRVNDRPSDSVCSQKIKPDSMCYSPNHYDELTGRIQGLNVHPSKGNAEYKQGGQRNPDRRLSTYDNVVVEPPNRSPERRVSSTTIYLQAQRNDAKYDPSRYTEPSQSRQPRVYYQGTSDIGVVREPNIRSKSYDGNADMSSFSPSRVPYNGVPPYHRPSPPSYDPAKPVVHGSSMVSSRPWYQDDASVYSDPILDSSSSPSRLRAISARMIPDKLVCERCCQVPISRQQRICAGCEEESYRRHKLLADTSTGILY